MLESAGDYSTLAERIRSVRKDLFEDFLFDRVGIAADACGEVPPPPVVVLQAPCAASIGA